MPLRYNLADEALRWSLNHLQHRNCRYVKSVHLFDVPPASVDFIPVLHTGKLQTTA